MLTALVAFQLFILFIRFPILLFVSSVLVHPCVRACKRACDCPSVCSFLCTFRLSSRSSTFIRALAPVHSFVRSFAFLFVHSFRRSFAPSDDLVCFLVSFSLAFICLFSLPLPLFSFISFLALHPSLSSLSPISDCLTLLNNPIPFFFHRLETCPIPAVFDSTGPVREMFENFAPQVKPTERRSIPKVPQSRCTGTSVILLRNSSNKRIRLRKTVVLTNKKKMFCDLIWKIRTVVRFRVVLKPIHSNLVWGAKIEKKTESSHFDLITTLATKKTLIEGVGFIETRTFFCS